MEEKNKDEAIEQLQYLQTIYAQEYDNLLREITNYNAVYNATRRNLEVLNNIDSLQNNKVLVNLEGGTYIDANIGKIEKIMVYVGSNYIVEKSIEEAKLFLEESKKRQEEIINELNKQKQDIEKALIDIGIEIEKIGNANV
jgi:prefoldin alpha subunit